MPKINVRAKYDTDSGTMTLIDAAGNNYPAFPSKHGTPVNAVAASGVFTVDGVVIHGETFSIDADVYQFAADAAHTIGSGHKLVDISTYAVKATNNLTIAAQPTAGDTMTIGGTLYTFVFHGTAHSAGEIDIGTDKVTAQANIKAALNGTDGINSANTHVTCGNFSNDAAAITALVGGIAGNSIATVETFTAETNLFSGATLGSGADCAKADARTAILAAIAANSASKVSAAAGSGDTINLTAKTKGAAGNSIATAETMAHGSFGAAHLASGVDGTVAKGGEVYYDSSYMYTCVADNTAADTNWRRVSLGSAF